MSEGNVRRVPLRNIEEEPPSKRRRLLQEKEIIMAQPRNATPLSPLSDPLLPDDIWRMIFFYLDVGHICKRMNLLSKNWSRSCWRFVSAYIPGPREDMNNKRQTFKYLRPKSLISQLVNLPNPQCLKSLTLRDLKLTESEVEPIYNFSNLTCLDLSLVRGRTFQKLSRLSSLRSLSTWNCEWVNSDVLRHIGCLFRLEHLTLNWCDQINDDGLQHLSTLTNLLSLGLNDLTNITEVGLMHLSTLTNLNTLTLAFNPVTDAMVKVIADHHSEKLQALDLDSASIGEGLITDDGAIALGKLTNLRRLKLGFHSFSPNGLKGLSVLTNLETLSLESNESAVSGDSLKTLSRLVHLRKLNLESCTNFDDTAMAALVHFTALENLNIAKTMFKRGLQYLSSKTHPKLKILDLSFSEKIDDTGLKYITRLTNLESLILYRCPKKHLTTKGTKALLALTNLKTLDCQDCPISSDVAHTLRSRIKDMRDTLPAILTMSVTGAANSDEIDKETLDDSDEEGNEMEPTTNQINMISHHFIDPDITNNGILGDLRNFEEFSDDEMNLDETNLDESDDFSESAFVLRRATQADEMEGIEEAQDRSLLAAMRLNKSQNMIAANANASKQEQVHFNNSGPTNPTPSTTNSRKVSPYLGYGIDFETEEMED